MTPSAPQNSGHSAAETQVPMSDIVHFLRQFSHDLRNHLNAAELQSAYLKEIAGEAEVKTELQRLRGMISEMGANLQSVTTLLAPVKVTRMRYDAKSITEDLKQKAASEFPDDDGAFEWSITSAETEIEIDPQLLQQALVELLRNALQHARGTGPIVITSEVTAGEFVLTLREPKKGFALSTEAWGREPFKRVKHGHYGLGLHRARSIIEAHGGQLTARYDPDGFVLITTVSLPLADA